MDIFLQIEIEEVRFPLNLIELIVLLSDRVLRFWLCFEFWIQSFQSFDKALLSLRIFGNYADPCIHKQNIAYFAANR